MHFRIDADGRRGLRVIGEIPDLDLCRLEGYNGIGKSAAIRLLEMCTGMQPYEGQDRAWRTFRAQLASARVVVTQLHQAERIEWILDPSAWPESPEPLGDRLGEIRIDGRRARSADIDPLLRVRRIAGDETLTDTLAARVISAGSQASRWMAEGGQGAQRRTRLDHVLDDLRLQVTRHDLERFQADRQNAQDVERQANQLRIDLQAAEERVKLLSEARRLLDQLDDVRGRGPSLDEQVNELDLQLRELDVKRAELDEQIVTLSEREQRDQQARREFQQAQRLLVRRERALVGARARLADGAVRAQVTPDKEAAKAAQDATKLQLEDLLDRQARVSTAPRFIRLAEELIGILRRAEEAGLGEEILIESVSAGTSLTTRQLRQALERQAAVRAAQPPTAESEQLAEQIEQVRAQIQHLGDVVGACETVAGATDRLRQANERMQAANSALPTSTATTMQRLLTARSHLERQIADVTARRAQVEQARSLLGGGLTEQVLAERLTRACQAAEVDASRISGELAIAERRLGELRETAPVVQGRADELRNQLTGRVREIGRTVAELHEDPATAWLRELHRQSPVLPGLDDEVSEQLRMLARLGIRLEKARARLTHFGGQVQAIGAALLELGSQFQGRTPTEMDWLREVRAWLAREVARWFDHAEVREALFPGGGDIEFDLAEMTVSWAPAGEERQTRPLEAFSSGEQAFAYTRARLARLDLDDATAANQLIALDEFGAFIAAKWMRHLARYLRDRHQRFPAEQILVVLPVSDDLQVGRPAEESLQRLVEWGDIRWLRVL